jgi:ankyrin repeat protein
MKSTVISKKLVIVSLILAGLLAATNLFSQETDLLSKVRANDIEGVKALCAAGADVNQEDDMMGYTALGLTKDIEMMKVLISAGADINHRDKRTGYTPLMNALNSCNTQVAKFLIEKGADINLKSNDGATALILSCGCSEEIAKQLLDKGADINALTDRGMGVFTQCTSVGLGREAVSYEFAEFLLSKGADIDEKNTTGSYAGYTPLFWAVLSDEEKLVSFLVKHGADVNAKSNNGKTPLSIATEAGSANIVEILKSAGAK